MSRFSQYASVRSVPEFKQYRTAAALLLLMAALSGCVGIAIGGAAVGTTVATDPRTPGTQLDDETIELKATAALAADEEIDSQSHISVVSYNGMVLIVGQIPSEALKARAAEVVARVDKVRLVYNELEIGAPTSIGTRGQDSLTSTELKTRLLSSDDVRGHAIKITVENQVVYLMGFATPAEGDIAAATASRMSGVRKVVKLFEYQPSQP